jgi:hypothetical protein
MIDATQILAIIARAQKLGITVEVVEGDEG